MCSVAFEISAGVQHEMERNQSKSSHDAPEKLSLDHGLLLAKQVFAKARRRVEQTFNEPPSEDINLGKS